MNGDTKMNMKVKVPLFFIAKVIAFVGGAGLSVIGQWDLAGLNMLEVLDKHLVVLLHLLDGLSADGPGHVLPAVGGVLVIHHQSMLEQFVLLGSPTT